jgi:hypothetical protein
VIDDNLKYTKKGRINRNRFLENGRDAVFTVPLRGASDSLDIRDRAISEDFNRVRLLNRMRQSYRRAPFFEPAFALFERVVLHPEQDLFGFLQHSIVETCRYLEIATKIVASSELSIDHSLGGESKVVAMCRRAGASVYITPIGGVALYSREAFAECGIDLKFLRPTEIPYEQFDNEFVAWLSILDVMMFNSVDEIRGFLTDGFELE